MTDRASSSCRRASRRRPPAGGAVAPAFLTLAVACAAACAAPRAAAAQARVAKEPAAVPVRDSIPGTLVTFELVAVPGGRATVPGPDGPRVVEVAPFLIGRTEVTWDAYDPFAFGPGSGGARGSADAVSRPSRPYGAPDQGFGHAGHPAISVTREAAEAYARWLSERTGTRYRLPTEAEWARAAALAVGERGAPLAAGRRDALAWHGGNAGGRTHPVATRGADALGLHDLFGNAAEWVTTDDGRPVARGGSWRDAAADVGPHARAVQDDSWNERDPQIPKSPWWLSDGPFVGFRIVRAP